MEMYDKVIGTNAKLLKIEKLIKTAFVISAFDCIYYIYWTFFFERS